MTATNTELRNYVLSYLGFVGLIHVVPGPWRDWSKGSSIDMWSFTHIAFGYLGAKMNQSLKQQMALATINELAEAIIRKYKPEMTWGTPEPGMNVPFDLAANALGWYLGSKESVPVPRKVPTRSPVSVEVIEKYEEIITED